VAEVVQAEPWLLGVLAEPGSAGRLPQLVAAGCLHQRGAVGPAEDGVVVERACRAQPVLAQLVSECWHQHDGAPRLRCLQGCADAVLADLAADVHAARLQVNIGCASS
jgi:hypothetical protein